MKYLHLSILILLFICFSLQAQEIPHALKKLGFTKYELVYYHKKGDIEYFTFYDWRTEEQGDLVIFVVEYGQIRDWFKGVGNEYLGEEI